MHTSTNPVHLCIDCLYTWQYKPVLALHKDRKNCNFMYNSKGAAYTAANAINHIKLTWDIILLIQKVFMSDQNLQLHYN